MFDIFKKGSNQIKVIDKIALSQNAKWENCLNEWKQNKNIVFVAWFDETADTFKSHISSDAREHPEVYQANEAQHIYTQNRSVIFLEHFPLRNKEIALFEKLHLKEVVVYSSLDEPFFMHIGSKQISQLMETLGMKENEILQHVMISTAIERMQKKLEDKITLEQAARSQRQWMNANIATDE